MFSLGLNQELVEKINALTKYPSIPTLHKTDSNGILTNELDESVTCLGGLDKYEWIFTEKIDGTNVRIVIVPYKNFQNNSYFFIGSRNNLLMYSEDLMFDRSMDIVSAMNELDIIEKIRKSKGFYDVYVIYGELYGHKIGGQYKNYTISEQKGFRVFDVLEIDRYFFLSTLEKPLEEVQKIRKRELLYNHNYKTMHFIRFNTIAEFCFKYNFFKIKTVPEIKHEVNQPFLSYVNRPDSLQGIYELLLRYTPTTLAKLDEGAKGASEGIVIRNIDKSIIAKARLYDYQRALKVRGK